MDQLTANNPTVPTVETPPVINCHTHIFTGKHVPPYLAKTILPGITHKVINLFRVFRFFHWWYAKGPGRWPVLPWYKKRARSLYKFRMLLARRWILAFLRVIVFLFLLLQFIDIICHWQFPASKKYTEWWMTDILIPVHHFLKMYAIPHFDSWWLKGLMIFLFFILFKSGRNLILFVAKYIYKWLGKIPGKETKQMFERYLTIGRFTFHETQKTVLEKLEDQYPAGTGFVILPMDMKYMDAGDVNEDYPTQMEDLAVLKRSSNHHLYPFVFVDPRRIKEDPGFFKYKEVNGTVILENCFIQKFIEDENYKFSGFKIYPALGYYPFDPLLLPLWKYAEQHSIPVLTHCVRGPMYFRGTKIKEWDFHPVFKQSMGNDIYDPLLLPERKNSEFTTNFTHPMNFLCLLKKEFLAEVVDAACKSDNGDKRLKAIFGLTESYETTEIIDGVEIKKRTAPVITNGLDDLKICFGHYGGGDEWERYFEADRYGHSAQVIKHPEKGIDFLLTTGKKPVPSPGKPEQLWKYTDWYSIISSMILQHKNVYADISYILHDDRGILPLLKQTLQNPLLRSKVLYGTDFYVVRNHKSDKNMLADMMGGLEVEYFDVIARENPRKFLNLPPFNKPTHPTN
ncbi:MAG TPA: hypothetical protein VGO58_00045 [Chitinophagaceae bacterium]|jgi:predicted TIM-barrel fold metal-dependent hydrolase|nr:hypothetical protein [Chitinophagaceae bacterium]